MGLLWWTKRSEAGYDGEVEGVAAFAPMKQSASGPGEQ